MYIKNKRGQSTVEYVLLVTAVLGVIIAFVAGNNSGFKTQLGNSLNTATSDVNTMASTLAASHDSTAAPTAAGTGTPPAGYVINAAP